tara:strand:- start:549 stop:863 length:315 start_codon:yes stop_codon:yes gene_type:complete
MILIIESCLSEPPSEIACFRDVTLFGKLFIFEDILVECKPGTRAIYWNWLKSYGAHDFISQLVLESEKQTGYTIKTVQGANYRTDRIDYTNTRDIIESLRKIKP